MNPKQGRELHAVSHGAGDQGSGNYRESQLKHNVDRFRKSSSQAVNAQIGKQQQIQVADECVLAGERQAVADQYPDHGDQTTDGEALTGDGEHVFAPYHAAIEHRDAGHGHHQTQHGGHEHPGRIAGVEFSGWC